MKKRAGLFFGLIILTSLIVSGCATAKPRRTDAQPATGPVNPQVAALQSELQAKDQQIQDLQYQLEQGRGPETNYSTRSTKGGKSSLITVSGVSVRDVQRALERAGFDPGRIDGKMGKKTKAAIKAFQRAHNLTADGVVGRRTWNALQS